jgi:methylaspartate ammonia-lyase
MDMKIVDVVLSAGLTGFYFDDQKAIKTGAKHDGLTYMGNPITEGFKRIRQAGESISVMLLLEDGQVAYGDCVTVQYSGVGGRDPLFLANDFIPVIETYVSPKLIGEEVSSFRELAKKIDEIYVAGKRLHSAIRYGVTQAILDAVAKGKKLTMAEVIKEEYNTGIDFKKIPIYTQSGDDRYDNVDKMIIKSADSLPHGLINNVEEKLGENGELLIKYITWLKERIFKLRASEEYSPILHLDVYGTIGLAFNNDLNKIVKYIGELEKVSFPFKLRLESPIDADARDKQLKILGELKSKLREKEIRVDIVADEWCNTLEDIKLFVDERAVDMIQIKAPDLGGVNNIIESILYCKKNGIGAFCGGSCNETEISAQICVNIALACGADQCLAKPGMGVDEGFMTVYNEMNRVLALSQARANRN